MFLLLLQRGDLLQVIELPTCHETLSMEKGETVHFTTSWSSSSHSSSTCHHIFPVKSFIFSFHCLHFYRPMCSQAKAFFVHEWELGQRPPKGPAQETVWPLFLCPASAPHILLTISSQPPATNSFIIVAIIIRLFCCLVLVFFSEKHSVKFKPSFHIPKALLFVNFIVDFFSLHFFPPLSWDPFLFWGTFNPVWMLLNSCSAMQPFLYRGLKTLEGVGKLLEISPAHLHKGEAPFSSSGLTYTSWPHSKSSLR